MIAHKRKFKAVIGYHARGGGSMTVSVHAISENEGRRLAQEQAARRGVLGRVISIRQVTIQRGEG